MAILAIHTYDIGDAVRCTITFATTDSTPTDPTTVTFTYRDPSGNETTWVFGVDAQVIKDDTGDYHADVTLDEDGLWHYRFEGTGALIAAAEHGFYVRRSEIV
jgi:hypothetical protein